MTVLKLVLLCVVVNHVIAREICVCTSADIQIQQLPSHVTPAVGALAAGSCLNNSQITISGQWIHLTGVELHPGYFFMSNNVVFKECAASTGRRIQDRETHHHNTHGNQDRETHRHHTHGNQDRETHHHHTHAFGACSVTCGTGTKIRHCHDCAADAPVQTHPCVRPDCPVWSDWSACSATCGHGHVARHCLQHCDNLTNGTEFTSCTHQRICPHWGAWSQCTVTCEDGTQTRRCHAHCPDHHLSTETRVCRNAVRVCPVWSEWSKCSTTCGPGHEKRHCHQHCPRPHHTHELRPCNYGPCPAVPQGSAHICNKLSTLHALAESNVTTETNCPERWSSDTARFLLSHCPGIPANTSHWSKGLSVAVDCNTTKSIPAYTPVGTFWNETYRQDRHDTHQGYSGIFIACTTNGFKMVTQACAGVTEVVDIPHDHVTEQHLGTDALHTNVPSHYFTVQW